MHPSSSPGGQDPRLVVNDSACSGAAVIQGASLAATFLVSACAGLIARAYQQGSGHYWRPQHYFRLDDLLPSVRLSDLDGVLCLDGLFLALMAAGSLVCSGVLYHGSWEALVDALGLRASGAAALARWCCSFPASDAWRKAARWARRGGSRLASIAGAVLGFALTTYVASLSGGSGGLCSAWRARKSSVMDGDAPAMNLGVMLGALLALAAGLIYVR